MSFQDFVGSGSGCSSGNAAMKFVDHLDKDRFKGFQSPPNLQKEFNQNNSLARPPPPPIQEQQLVNEFFETQKLDLPIDNTFKFNDMSNELNNVINAPPPTAVQLQKNGNWVDEFQLQNNFMPPPQLSNEEEKEFEHAFQEAIKHNQELEWNNEFIRQEHIAGANLQKEEIEQFENIYEKHTAALNEEDWTQQFQQVEKVLNENVKEEEYLNWKEEFEKNAYSTAQIDDTENQELNEAWNNATEENWESEFENYEQNNDESHFSYDPDPITGELEPYIFEVVNPYLDNPNAFEEGLELMKNGGSLSKAALAFEAVVQKDPKNSEAWMYLGNVQADNEKEHPAIAALQRAVRENPRNLTALMSLAVSYTNEAMNLQAYCTLERWIKIQYPDIVKSNPRRDQISHSYIISLFLEAARQGPAKAVQRSPESEKLAYDPDVQSGLGILFFNNFDYEKAADCFTSALSVKPDDYLLWNRLGATLANSGRCEEASNAYYQALEIKPTFVRCRFNLGIACMNIGCYKEAVEHFLGALSMQIIRHGGKDGNKDDAGINISNSIWETLRRTFVLMERHDLVDYANENTDLSFFANEFEF